MSPVVASASQPFRVPFPVRRNFCVPHKRQCQAQGTFRNSHTESRAGENHFTGVPLQVSR
jgi:hypothetical protein